MVTRKNSKVIHDFENLRDDAEIRALSNKSLRKPLTDKEYRRMKELADKKFTRMKLKKMS